MIWIVVILVTLVVIGIFALSGLGALAAGRNGSAVEFTLNDFAGKSIHLSDYHGKPVLVNLWASWCPP
ncbi:MAG TPA: TlpA disulfide reductase family protein, partial [Anaerolineae bacterium]